MSLKSIFMERCMRWLGLVCQIYNSHHPKKLLLGELVTPEPFHGNIGEIL